jgi:nitroreductase
MLSPFADDRRLFRIVRAAQLAPSVLNTQPWSFWVRADDRIDLRAKIGQPGDRHPGRWLTHTDPDARELAISCGAALFNLRIAIRVTGHDVVTWLLPDPDGDPALLASVEIVTGRVKRPSDVELELYDMIPRRHTNRWPFSRRRVQANVLAAITSAAANKRRRLRVLFPFQVTSWLEAAGQAERELAHDKPYVAELRQWTSGAGPGLGVPKPAYGPRAMPLPENPPVRDFSLDPGDGRPVEPFESHPQLLVLATKEDRPLDWLQAGQALQRALLTATRYGVAASFLTQPLELADQWADQRHEQRGWPCAWPFDETPQMLIRVGYPAHDPPITPRESSPDVVDFRSHPPRLVLPPDLTDAEQELSSRWHQHGRLPG